MIDEAAIDALNTLTYGLYIVSSRDGEKLNGQLANAVCQVTAVPPKIMLGVHKDNLTHEYISKSKVVGISALEERTPMPVIGLFGFKSGRDVDKLAGVRYREGVTGAPVVTDHAVTTAEGNVVDQVSAGTHTLFIVEVTAAEILAEAPPLTYAYYRAVRHGKSSKNAPTYKPPAEEAERERSGSGMKKYVCNVCGYVYDPGVGDPDNNIAPGTAFDNLPDDWVCPVCGAGKDDFTARE